MRERNLRFNFERKIERKKIKPNHVVYGLTRARVPSLAINHVDRGPNHVVYGPIVYEFRFLSFVHVCVCVRERERERERDQTVKLLFLSKACMLAEKMKGSEKEKIGNQVKTFIENGTS